MKLDLEDALDQAMAVDGPASAGRRPDIGEMLDAMGLVDAEEAERSARSDPATISTSEPKADPLDREVKGPLLKRLLELRADANPERAPWPEQWFSQTDSGQVSACQRLWGSVLFASLQDAFRRLRAAREYPPAQRPGHERSAMAWIGTRDFREVCDFAGFDAQQLATWARAEALSEAPGEAILARMTKGGEA